MATATDTERMARWRAANPERAHAIQRKSDLKRRYGIEPDDYDALLAAQGERCASCGTDDPGGSRGRRYFCVDHNHDTGEVRALLCDDCNVALGRLKDDPNRIAGLLAYALTHEG